MGAECSQPRNGDDENPLHTWKAFGLIDFPDQGDDDDDYDIDQVRTGLVSAFPPHTTTPSCKRLILYVCACMRVCLRACVLLQACFWEGWREPKTRRN